MSITDSYSITEYPRPQYRRESWSNLNGLWKFNYDDNNIGELEKWYSNPDFIRDINVPFTYETKASGIDEKTFHPNVWYHREFTVEKKDREKEVILRFQRSDYLTKVWINGIFVGKHEGGNSSFSFNISNEIFIHDSNTIVVKVEDSYDTGQPRGKQKWTEENFGCWYTQTTGIWQTVWIEYVNKFNINNVKITPNIDKNSVTFDYCLSQMPTQNIKILTKILFNDKEIQSIEITPNIKEFTADISLIDNAIEWGIHLWTPDTPNLYDVVFELKYNDKLSDKVKSYFGMRKMSTENGQILLNNEPIYQKLLLDQGYWPESNLTPPSEKAILEDIDKTLSMGFNGIRKHQKLEDERFLYWCDKKGLLVWSEMAATYSYSDGAVSNFTKEWLEILKQHYNHPAIVCWVPFNESWGVPRIKTDKKQQAFTQSIYYLTKSYDSERPVIVNDGWEHTISDIIALHDYEEVGQVFKNRYENKYNILDNKVSHNGFKFAFADGFKYDGQPVMITEYGGIAFAEGEGWGYGNQVNTEDEFLSRYKSITDAIKQIPYICGYCYTQTTDVQQEINGLLKEDRTPKIEMKKIKEINDSTPTL